MTERCPAVGVARSCCGRGRAQSSLLSGLSRRSAWQFNRSGQCEGRTPCLQEFGFEKRAAERRARQLAAMQQPAAEGAPAPDPVIKAPKASVPDFSTPPAFKVLVAGTISAPACWRRQTA